MGLLDRFKQGFKAFASAPTEAVAAQRIDFILDPSTTPEELEKYIVEKSSDSKLDIRKTTHDLALANFYMGLRSYYGSHITKIPPYGDPGRDEYISNIWRHEPIMAGAVYSMTAKMTALRWTVTGRRKKAMDFARVLAEAAHIDGYDWGGFISSTAQDFYLVNRGVFWETPRVGDSTYGKLSDLGHIDALSCTLTGNKDTPMLYMSEMTGQAIRFRHGEYIHFASLPSARERHLGIGFCAVDRAYRALKLLMALHDYDEEKLSNLPPEGIATVTGLTMDEFTDAVALWKAQREKDKSLTFPQVLWLIGSNPNAKVDVDIKAFSSIPESFDRDKVVSHYVSTLALDFGVDAREFWPISSGALGTASESEIQHLKAKGKGPGEFISTTERRINGEADEDTQFAFDTQDIEEDMNAAAVAKAWVDAYYPLFTGQPAGKSKASPGGKPNTEAVPNPNEVPQSDAAGQAMSAGAFGNPGQPAPEQVITKEDLLRLLADRHVIPEWMLNDKRQMVLDTTIHISKELDPDEYTSFVWDGRYLKEHRLPPIVLDSPTPEVRQLPAVTPVQSYVVPVQDLQAIQYLKQKEDEIFADQRNIIGNPIPEQEVTRGARITANTLRDELERWRKHPLLSKYALTEDELKAIIAKEQKQ
jgi:hypothetical protein